MTFAETFAAWQLGFSADLGAYGAKHGLAGTRAFVLPELNTAVFLDLPGDHTVAEKLGQIAQGLIQGQGLRAQLADLISAGIGGAGAAVFDLLGGHIPGLHGRFVLAGFLAELDLDVIWGQTEKGSYYPRPVEWFGPSYELASTGHLFRYGSVWSTRVPTFDRESLRGLPVG